MGGCWVASDGRASGQHPAQSGGVEGYESDPGHVDKMLTDMKLEERKTQTGGTLCVGGPHRGRRRTQSCSASP